METQHNLAKVLREVEAGHEVAITRHKKVVARLTSPQPEGKVTFPDFEKRARRTWKAAWPVSSSEQLLDETRGDR